MEKVAAKSYRKVYDYCSKGKLIAGHYVQVEGSVGVVQFVDIALRELLVSFEDNKIIGVVYFEDIELFSRCSAIFIHQY